MKWFRPGLGLPAVACGLLSGSAATAQVTGFHVAYGSAEGSSGPVVTNDLFLDFDGPYTGSQVIIELTQGTINQELFFGGPQDTAPSPEALAAFPELAADTWFTQGGLAGQQLHGTPVFPGGAVNLDPRQPARVETPTSINNAWLNPPPDTFAASTTNFQVLHLSLSPDAAGTISYFASANGVFFYTDAANAGDGDALGSTRTGNPLYEIRNGRVVPVPEPALAAALPVVLLTQRRSCRRR